MPIFPAVIDSDLPAHIILARVRLLAGQRPQLTESSVWEMPAKLITLPPLEGVIAKQFFVLTRASYSWLNRRGIAPIVLGQVIDHGSRSSLRVLISASPISLAALVLALAALVFGGVTLGIGLAVSLAILAIVVHFVHTSRSILGILQTAAATSEVNVVV